MSREVKEGRHGRWQNGLGSLFTYWVNIDIKIVIA